MTKVAKVANVDIKSKRNWCRATYGKDWWDVEKSIKKTRLKEAEKFLAATAPCQPTEAVSSDPDIDNPKLVLQEEETL